jgi:Flp pilus assembly protein TadD
MATDLQNRKRAGDLLRRLTSRNPEDAAAHDRLARFLLASADLPRAGYQLQEVVRLRPGDGPGRRDLALVQRLLDLRGE